MQTHCVKCDEENSDQAEFCQRCGASLQQPTQPPSIPRTFVGERVVGVIGLVGGILVLVGVFSPWMTVSGWGFSEHASAWDSITQATGWGEVIGIEGWAILALAGAVFLLVAALFGLAAPHMRLLWGMVFMGGLAAIASSLWAFVDIESVSGMDMSFGYGYGLYLTLVGGILGLPGASGLRG